MEWIGSALISILVVLTLCQLLMAHAISVIARKNDLGSMMEVFAWIPLLQLAPILAIGGGSVGIFLLGSVALILGNVVVLGSAAMLGDALGGILSGLALAFSLLIALGYYARIVWATATGRGLSGWIGMLMFIPLLNLFVYPFIAFHDGWGRPHVAGMILGTLITVGTSLPSFHTINMIQNDPDVMANLAKLSSGEGIGDLGALSERSVEVDDVALEDGTAPDPLPAALPREVSAEVAQDHERSIRALFELKGRFEALDQLTKPANMKIQDNRVRALNQIRRLRTNLEARKDALDSETYEELADHLHRVEAQVRGPDAIPSRNPLAMNKSPRSGTSGGQAGPASIAGSRKRSTAPENPFPVHVSETCPHGTELRTRSSEKGEEEWCQQFSHAGGLRHGWYARYFEAGQPEQVGEYRDGLRIGVWTRFHRTGEVRAQAEFDQGLQHGWLLSFDESGQREKAVRFDRGAAIQ